MNSSDSRATGSSRRQHLFQRLAAVVTAAGAGTLGACGAPGAVDDADASPGTLPPAKLTYMHGYKRPDQVAFIDQHIAAFRQDYPNIEIEQQIAPVGEKLIAAAAAGTPPDLIRSYPQHINDFAAKGILLDLTSRVKTSRAIDLKDPDLPQTAFDEMRLDGGLYAVPDTQAAVMIFYNKDLLRKAGIREPTDRWTTADVLAMAKQATNRDAGVWGFNITRKGVRMMPCVWGNGGEYYDERYTKTLIDQPAVYEAYQWAADFVARYHYTPTPEEAKQIPRVPGGAFATGVYALHVQNTGGLQDARASWQHLNWSFVAWPRGSKGQFHLIDAVGAAVTSGSNYPDHAWRYVEFAGSVAPQQLQSIEVALGQMTAKEALT
ncbi:MAG: ABC transporter substrate-binding protein, partial [Chloroflexota bacterium]